MSLLGKLIVHATVAAVESIDYNNQYSPNYGNNYGGFLVCTNCALTMPMGAHNCPRCGAPANAYPQQPPHMNAPVQQQDDLTCKRCGADKSRPGPCEYCGK